MVTLTKLFTLLWRGLFNYLSFHWPIYLISEVPSTLCLQINHRSLGISSMKWSKPFVFCKQNEAKPSTLLFSLCLFLSLWYSLLFFFIFLSQILYLIYSLMLPLLSSTKVNLSLSLMKLFSLYFLSWALDINLTLSTFPRILS